MNIKKLCISSGVALISVLLIGMGVSIFVECGLGADTLTVLLAGLHKSVNISLDTASLICSCTLLLLACCSLIKQLVLPL